MQRIRLSQVLYVFNVAATAYRVQHAPEEVDSHLGVVLVYPVAEKMAAVVFVMARGVGQVV